MSIDIIRISIENYSDFSVTYDVLLLLPGFCQYSWQKLHKDYNIRWQITVFAAPLQIEVYLRRMLFETVNVFVFKQCSVTTAKTTASSFAFLLFF